ncbi:hypothetical protein AaE_011775 [Aphanomyces astaci]|uniref:ORC6 second cyclin-like domain-containing protein n=1 Tax=Aphanomyces astaci TaxID=112090 RepID=A0A6A4ZN61_APHAT|nr:hypothetical protein AaE_011775 [Aphanomyces astaci]
MLDRPAACLELACEVLQEPFDSRKLYMLSGGTSLGKHKQCVRNISGILRLQTTTTITTASLCVKFGCPGLKDYVASVHDEYKHRMMAKLTATQQRYVDVTRPLFPAAVFYTCAQKASYRVDKNQLLQLTMSQPKEFGSVVSSIEVFSTHATLCSTDDYLEGIVSTCTDQVCSRGHCLCIGSKAETKRSRRIDTRRIKQGEQLQGREQCCVQHTIVGPDQETHSAACSSSAIRHP